MQFDLGPAAAFGTLLRENEAAANYYDRCTPAEKQDILLHLHEVDDMKSYVEHLPPT